MARLTVPSIPYDPAPDVKPTGAIPDVHVSTPGDAFGENVAGAISHMGGTLDTVGNELFQRAIGFQNIKNEAEANDAVNKYISDGTMASEKFKTLQGKNAVDAYDAHRNEINTMRSDIRSSLSSDAVRRMYDRETLSAARQLQVQAAGHSGREHKQWLVGSAEASERLEEDRIQNTPLDDKLYRDTLDKVNKSAEFLGDMKGWGGPDSPQTRLYEHNRRSFLVAQRVRGLASSPNSNDVVKAQEFFDNNKDQMNEKDLIAAQSFLQGHVRGVVSRMTSDNVNDHHEGPGTWPGLTPKERSVMNAASEPLGRGLRQGMIDNDDLGLRIVGADGDGRGMDILANGTPDDAIAKLKQTYQNLDIPVEVTQDGDKIHVAYPEGYDPSTAPKPISESLASRDARSRAYATKTHPDDVYMESSVSSRTRGDYTHAEEMRNDQQRTQDRQVGQLVIGQNMRSPEAVRKALTDQFGNSKAWDDLDPRRQEYYLKIMSGEIKREVSDKNRWGQLYGMSHSGEPDDINEFLNLDLTKEPLSQGDYKTLFARQEALKKDPKGDPRLRQAMGWLAPSITADMTKEEKNQFQGELLEQLEDFSTDQKRLPVRKDVVEMANNLVLKQAVKNAHWYSGLPIVGGDEAIPYYKIPVTEKEIQAQQQNPYWARRHIEPTQEMLERAARREKYQKTFGKATPAAPVATPAEAPAPEVPK